MAKYVKIFEEFHDINEGRRFVIKNPENGKLYSIKPSRIFVIKYIL